MTTDEQHRRNWRNAQAEMLREAWKNLEGQGLRIAQVSGFPLDVTGTYAKLIHLPRRARFYLQVMAGLTPMELLALLRAVQLQLDEPSAGWIYRPEQRHRSVPEQRICGYTSTPEPAQRLIGTMAGRR